MTDNLFISLNPPVISLQMPQETPKIYLKSPWVAELRRAVFRPAYLILVQQLNNREGRGCVKDSRSIAQG